MFCIYCRTPFDEEIESICSNCGKALYKERRHAQHRAQHEHRHEPGHAPETERPWNRAPEIEALDNLGLLRTCKKCGMQFPVTCYHCNEAVTDPGATVPPHGYMDCGHCGQTFWVRCPHCYQTQEQSPGEQPLYTVPQVPEAEPGPQQQQPAAQQQPIYYAGGGAPQTQREPWQPWPQTQPTPQQGNTWPPPSPEIRETPRARTNVKRPVGRTTGKRIKPIISWWVGIPIFVLAATATWIYVSGRLPPGNYNFQKPDYSSVDWAPETGEKQDIPSDNSRFDRFFGNDDSGETAISAGTYHSLVLKGGTLYSWGNRSQIGREDGDTGTPGVVMEDVAAIAAGSHNSLAIKEDGSLWAWGDKGWGDDTGEGSFPHKVMDNVVAAAVGQSEDKRQNFALAIRGDGSLWAWGNNKYGQLGNGTETESDFPEYDTDWRDPVKVMDGDVVAVTAGQHFSLAIKSDGTLWAWGRLISYGGESGNTPVMIMENVKAAAAGAEHILVLQKDGSLWVQGSYSRHNGALGLGEGEGTHTTYGEFVRVLENVTAIAAGGEQSMAVTLDGELLAWGKNDMGELGDGTTENRFSPIKIMDGVADVSTSGKNTLVLKTDGTIWSFGTASTSGVGGNMTRLPFQITDFQ